MAVYYNEIDPFAAAWLRELIKAGLIADGEVDERSIEFVQPDDVRGFVQCHFFAGIGGWSLALRWANWGDSRPVWTGSCPCQPFSSAGSQVGGNDPRDLWPVWFQLVKECRPVIVFGEQVEAAIGHGWLDRLCDDLEAEDYAVGACGLPGPSVGAFDIRQRLWFVAESDASRCRERQEQFSGASQDSSDRHSRRTHAGGHGRHGALADTNGRDTKHGTLQRGREHGLRTEDRCFDGCAGVAEQSESALDDSERLRTGRSAGSEGRSEREASSGRQDERRGLLQTFNTSAVSELGDTEGTGLQRQRRECGPTIRHERGRQPRLPGDSWRDFEWVACIDGKARPVEPGTFPLAHGVSGRMAVRMPSQQADTEIQEIIHWYNRTGALKGFGNAIKPDVAQVFIEAYMSLTA